MSGSDKKSTPSKLSLLTKHKSQTSSSITFPTFRFSPESEEIQEITPNDLAEFNQNEAIAEASGGSAEGSRTSPEPSPSSSSTSKQPGDVSPLKEYIMKHKWANKWEKRSLSLDLDLKGKIITAIEDKRRSFVSHFYNEEDEDPTLISTSQSIPEQLISTQDEDCDSIHSDSLIVRSHGYNFQEENNTDYYEEFQLSSSLPCTPAEFKPTNTITSTIDPVLNENNLRDLIIEEIGVDCCNQDISMELGGAALREFVLPPDSLRELFQGIPALYNPPAVVGSSRPFPIQTVIEPETQLTRTPSEEITPENESYTDLSVSSLVKRILHDIVRDTWVKYWVAVFACLILLNLPNFITNGLWFALGVMGAIIVIGPFRNEESTYSGNQSESRMMIGNTPSIVDKQNSGFEKSQGWMLTFPIETDIYSPLTHHLRSTKVVFIRIHGYNLLVSYPHSKHKIPKRRLWNDPIINTDHMFVRHTQYNLHGSKIEIVPIGLSKKRVWCKKYPISITLACQDHMVGKIQEVVEDDAVNFNSKEDGKVDLRNTRVKGQVTKESCDGRVLFLFARTDREKDDWYRRLINASKSTATSSPRSSPSHAPDFNSFVRYMKRACPTLRYANTSPTTPRNDWESVSISSVPKSSTSSSRKSTPEKESSHDHVLTPSFLNAFIARLFYDFLKSPRWTNEIKSLIDRKLFFIRKPPFVESIRVKELDLGSCMPVFLTASAPLLDSQGLWVDLEMEYTGNMIITLEMYVNLLKMRSEEKESERKRRASPPSREHAMFDSDADDSGESSESDEDELALEEKMIEKSNENRGKLMKYADSIAKSSVMKNKHVQKVVGNIAATPILLTVEIKRLAGVLAINLSPVPSDRVWVGFRGNPVVEISARPKFGERALGFSYLTEWIKRKILLEFQRVMVCPNMMDISVGLMEFNLPK
ncbi:unnamed protein product [Orchesella dallaii]|uniref:SMP-LTD domain-containing protein n=1 Tax=Orchesella dallaii TaxID=48710 RepID=A0ABP1RA01_9HEXA